MPINRCGGSGSRSGCIASPSYNHSMQRRLMRILLFAVILLLVLFGYSQYLRRTSLFYPQRYPLGDWTAKAADETFTTSDGVKLHGWYFAAADAPAPLLVWMHGNAGNG